MNKFIFLILLVVFMSGCGSKDWYQIGYSDGYATGYNTTCNIRATLIHGEWGKKKYKAGYDAGYLAGAADCRAN